MLMLPSQKISTKEMLSGLPDGPFRADRIVSQTHIDPCRRRLPMQKSLLLIIVKQPQGPIAVRTMRASLDLAHLTDAADGAKVYCWHDGGVCDHAERAGPPGNAPPRRQFKRTGRATLPGMPCDRDKE